MSNQEFDWKKESLTVRGGVVSGPCERISMEEVHAAISKMKNNKAAGPSGGGSGYDKGYGEKQGCSG